MHSPLKTLDDLLAIVEMLPGDDFEEIFKELHHFSSPSFRTQSPRFKGFVDYCQGLTRGIVPGQENEQTIQRAYRFMELRRAGKSQEESKAEVWEEFPLMNTRDRLELGRMG